MRCFIALPLPDEAAAALAGLTRELSRVWPHLAWVRSEGFHLTLAFIGELDETGKALAARALAGLAEPGFVFRFAGLGGFPPPGPWRLLYAALDDGRGSPAARLHRALNEALRAAERAEGRPPLNAEWLGEGRDEPFVAHVTLARAPRRPERGRRIPAGGPGDSGRAPQGRLRPRDLEPFGARIAESLAGQWTIDSCSLYKSELRRGGAVYTELDRIALGAPRPPGAESI